ncbi:MAG: hypothetical protein WCY77_03835 [Weeksellaceae bacterium]
MIQLLACLAAIYKWKSIRKTPLWIFLPFLIYSFLNEVTTTALYSFTSINFRYLYNIYCIVSFFVYLYWFDRILKLKLWKWIVTLVFLGAVVYDVITSDSLKQLIKTALLVQAIILLIFSVIYFVRLLNKEEVVHYQLIPEFWIILGLLVFHIAFVPLFLLTGLGYNIQKAYSIAINILNYILYSSYILGFYVAGKR